LGWLKALWSRRKYKTRTANDFPVPEEGYAPFSRDTMTAISELSRVAKNNPDAVEIYLALGNLYRSQGEIERAVQIRRNLIVRPRLDEKFKAKAWYELGLDYKRGGFVDRAVNAFEQAGKLSGNFKGVSGELAGLTARSGDNEKAAKYYSGIGHKIAEAHYLVKTAQERFAQDMPSSGWKWVKKALKAYPGSVEAWLESMIQDYREKAWKSLAGHFENGLKKVDPSLSFVLLEGLLAFAAKQDALKAAAFEIERPFQYRPDQALAEAILPVLEKQEPDLLLLFYAAWVSSGHDPALAKSQLEKTLVLNPGFWPARLELLALGMEDQPLSPAFQTQLEFFIMRARELKRFVCRKCGLKRETMFFLCPRCQSWHSISYRTAIHE